jgi:hypothetical protein
LILGRLLPGFGGMAVPSKKACPWVATEDFKCCHRPPGYIIYLELGPSQFAVLDGYWVAGEALIMPQKKGICGKIRAVE